MTYMVFACNAVRQWLLSMKKCADVVQAVAIVGFCVLLFSHFPPDGSRRFDEMSTDETVEST
jgi:hypothetical protein